MRLKRILLIFVGFLVEFGQLHGHGGKHVHVKIWVPLYKHLHKHTHVVYKQPKEEKKIIIHQHHHHHGHDHDHGHKHKHDHKHKHQHHKHQEPHHHHQYDHQLGWNKYSESSSFSSGGGNFKPSPEIDSYRIIPKFGPDFNSYQVTESAIREPLHHVTSSYKVQGGDTNDYQLNEILKSDVDFDESSEADEEEGENENFENDIYGSDDFETKSLNEVEALKQFFRNEI